MKKLHLHHSRSRWGDDRSAFQVSLHPSYSTGCSPIGPTGPPRVAVPRVCLRGLKNLQKYSTVLYFTVQGQVLQ